MKKFFVFFSFAVAMIAMLVIVTPANSSGSSSIPAPVASYVPALSSSSGPGRCMVEIYYDQGCDLGGYYGDWIIPYGSNGDFVHDFNLCMTYGQSKCGSNDGGYAAWAKGYAIMTSYGDIHYYTCPEAER